MSLTTVHHRHAADRLLTTSCKLKRNDRSKRVADHDGCSPLAVGNHDLTHEILRLLPPQANAVLDVRWLGTGTQTQQIEGIDSVRPREGRNRAPPCIVRRACEAME